MLGLSDDVLRQLRELYETPGSKSFFSAPYPLYKEAKKRNLAVTYSQVVKFLQMNQTYTTHRPQRRRFLRASLIAYGLDYSWSADTCYMTKFSRQNGGIWFLLSEK